MDHYQCPELARNPRRVEASVGEATGEAKRKVHEGDPRDLELLGMIIGSINTPLYRSVPKLWKNLPSTQIIEALRVASML